ncbi:DUF4105 domain-containing protein [Nitrosococcus watsonii]|uniref:Lnb N-terminal periplasmic domain-containing protein n=1 Tax=Nitrosococcus watsoni (strain C-113) TaxID=105559 RepID=D8K499_NITWC|nr:DUF4105 domain-containing protein [Nitrosococcus watsonii]ADJ27796.1 conserved hypothetical protein [Nitrosococcus watsonii C-113]
MRAVKQILATLTLGALLGWMALAISYSPLQPEWLRIGLAVLIPLGALLAFFRMQSRRWVVAGVLVVFLMFLVWWLAIPPSNERHWQPDVAVLAFAEFHGDQVTVHNVRNNQYRTETDYTVRFKDQILDLAQLRSLDLFVSYWGSPLIAHTILSWGFDGDQYLAISIETRKEMDEQYSAIKGFFKQYELIYVVADERDLVGLRTNYRDEDVYLYRLQVSPDTARQLLISYLQTINQLRESPEWYNALTQNCTTAVRGHVLPHARHAWWSWRLLLNGYIGELAYDLGVVGQSLPFPVLKAQSRINEQAKGAAHDPSFSVRIREGLPNMDNSNFEGDAM